MDYTEVSRGHPCIDLHVFVANPIAETEKLVLSQECGLTFEL